MKLTDAQKKTAGAIAVIFFLFWLVILLEPIAVAWGFNAEGGTRNFPAADPHRTVL